MASLTSDQQQELLAPYRQAQQALESGQFAETHFRALADCFNVAETLAKSPFNLLSDRLDEFETALGVLGQLVEHFNENRRWVADAAQMYVVKEALAMHKIQLEFVSQSEVLQAAAKVARRTMAALAGQRVANWTVIQVVAEPPATRPGSSDG